VGCEAAGMYTPATRGSHVLSDGFPVLGDPSHLSGLPMGLQLLSPIPVRPFCNEEQYIAQALPCTWYWLHCALSPEERWLLRNRPRPRRVPCAGVGTSLSLITASKDGRASAIFKSGAIYMLPVSNCGVSLGIQQPGIRLQRFLARLIPQIRSGSI
jgi:hypothetical protein